MPVVCRKIAYGQAGALQPISELLWQRDGRIEVAIVPGQSIYAPSHETFRPTGILPCSQADIRTPASVR
jgi:hypothetical protein